VHSSNIRGNYPRDVIRSTKSIMYHWDLIRWDITDRVVSSWTPLVCKPMVKARMTWFKCHGRRYDCNVLFGCTSDSTETSENTQLYKKRFGPLLCVVFLLSLGNTLCADGKRRESAEVIVISDDDNEAGAPYIYTVCLSCCQSSLCMTGNSGVAGCD